MIFDKVFIDFFALKVKVSHDAFLFLHIYEGSIANQFTRSWGVPGSVVKVLLLLLQLMSINKLVLSSDFPTLNV